MAFVAIRRATSMDEEALLLAKREFIERHGIQVRLNDPNEPYSNDEAGATAIALYEAFKRDPSLEREYRKIVSRALGDPRATGIEYERVGYYVSDLT